MSSGKDKSANVMRTIRIEKVTLNIGTGKEKTNIERGKRLLNLLTGKTPVITLTQKRIPGWGLRPGLPVGVKLTVRNDFDQLLKNFFEAKDFVLSESSFDDHGNISFGIKEYIDIGGMKYDPDVGMMGLQVVITLSRPGFRIKHRKLSNKKVPASHKIFRGEAVSFLKSKFDIKLAEEMEEE